MAMQMLPWYLNTASVCTILLCPLQFKCCIVVELHKAIISSRSIISPPVLFYSLGDIHMNTWSIDINGIADVVSFRTILPCPCSCWIAQGYHFTREYHFTICIVLQPRWNTPEYKIVGRCQITMKNTAQVRSRWVARSLIVLLLVKTFAIQ